MRLFWASNVSGSVNGGCELEAAAGMRQLSWQWRGSVGSPQWAAMEIAACFTPGCRAPQRTSTPACKQEASEWWGVAEIGNTMVTLNILHLQLNCKIIVSVNTCVKNLFFLTCCEKNEFHVPKCIFFFFTKAYVHLILFLQCSKFFWTGLKWVTSSLSRLGLKALPIWPFLAFPVTSSNTSPSSSLFALQTIPPPYSLGLSSLIHP